MNFKTFIFAAAATALTGTAALPVGQDMIDQITQDLASQGYARIVIKNMPNAVKVEAYGPNGTLERLYRADGSVARSEGAGSRDVVIGQTTTDDRGIGDDTQVGNDRDQGGHDRGNDGDRGNDRDRSNDRDRGNDGADHRDNGNESHGSGHDNNDDQGSGHDRTDSHGAGHDSNDRDNHDNGGDHDTGGADRD